MGVEKIKAFIGHIKRAPHYMVDNEFVQTGYRIGFHSGGSICKSLFMLHNESVNIWSHIMGVLFFFGLLAWTIISINPFSSYFGNGENQSKTATSLYMRADTLQKQMIINNFGFRNPFFHSNTSFCREDNSLL